MKLHLHLLPALGLLQLPLHAQVTVVAPPPAPGVVVVRGVRPGVRVLDPVAVRSQLSQAPRAVIVPTPPASIVVAAPPVEVVKTTKTTTVVDTPGRPLRVYNSERSVVVVENRELPYVTIPVLFVKETAELLDAESRASLEQVAAVILEVSKTEPGTLFDIEGHTSTDGTDEFNMNLSAARAQRVYQELTQRYGVPATALSAHGYGESFPTYPNGTEDEMQQDRRVLVVRTK
jgi:outer membrane protein OmpA-like peptidoglycan-associated protein